MKIITEDDMKTIDKELAETKQRGRIITHIGRFTCIDRSYLSHND